MVVDCTGGSGDAAILNLINLGYKNLYYEDSNQKTYTLQNRSYENMKYMDKLPGFHFQGNRYPVLSNFAGMVRNNEFKIRSNRVINELDTWIFKGEAKRMDHQDGAHDDTICALAMALFVMRFTLNRVEETVRRDKAILGAYLVGNGQTINRKKTDGNMMSTMPLPFYTPRTNLRKEIRGNFMWFK